jgi:Uma2 family endonuclease
LFEAHGVLEYWLIDPAMRSVRRLVLRDGQYEETAELVMASTVLEGLVIEATELFEDVEV